MNRKREIADRVIARWKERGFALDADPHYMRLVELWVEGAIGGAEMRQRYASALQALADERAGRISDVTSMRLTAGIDFTAADGGPHGGSASCEPQDESESLPKID